MNGRWAINIDIEGFSRNYEHSEQQKAFAIRALCELMNAIFKLGTCCYPGNPNINFSDRLFAHQFGDGFLICSDFPEQDGTRAVAIAIAIVRNMILNRVAVKAAISSGDMADIRGCYPESIRDAKDEMISMGSGLMTIISVMGTALTKAHRLAAKEKGAVLIVDETIRQMLLPRGLVWVRPNIIDWVTSELPLADDLSRKANLKTANALELYEKLEQYCKTEPEPPADWVTATLTSIRRPN